MAGSPLPVLTAVPGPDEARLVGALGRSTGVVVVRRCADLGELLSASAAGHGRAALVSPDLHRLDREALARLALAGTTVVGVLPAADPGPAAARLTALGVHRHVTADAPGDAVAAAVLAAVGGAAAPGAAAPAVPAVRRALDDTFDDDDGAGPPTRPTRGRLVAVWGPPGAPGRTTVATSLAAELAAAGEQVLLVDADTWAASTAQVLGLLDESAGIAAACRAAAAGVLTPRRLADLAPEAAPRLRVLTGLPRADRWHELGVAALEELWATCRATASWTVVDCAAPLEADEELLLEVAAPRRNAATTTALAAADVALVVGQADPVGLQRLVRALGDLAEAQPEASARSRVVVTKVRSAAVGPDAPARVAEVLARYAGVRGAVLVPDDRPACDAALLTGRALPESAPGSPARAALAALAAQLREEAGGVPARQRRRRWARMRR